MKTFLRSVVLLLLLLLFPTLCAADSYTALKSANAALSEHLKSRDSLMGRGGLSWEEMSMLQTQNAAEQNALQQNQKSESARGSTSSGGPSSSSGAGSSGSPGANPALQVQPLQVPEANYDTTPKDDVAELDNLQNQVVSMTQALSQPVLHKELSIEDSVDQEIKDIEDAAKTQVALLKTAATFTKAARQAEAAAQEKRKASLDQTTLADEIDSKGKHSEMTSLLSSAASEVDKLAEKAQSGKTPVK